MSKHQKVIQLQEKLIADIQRNLSLIEHIKSNEIGYQDMVPLDTGRSLESIEKESLELLNKLQLEYVQLKKAAKNKIRINLLLIGKSRKMYNQKPYISNFHKPVTI